MNLLTQEIKSCDINIDFNNSQLNEDTINSIKNRIINTQSDDKNDATINNNNKTNIGELVTLAQYLDAKQNKILELQKQNNV